VATTSVNPITNPAFKKPRIAYPPNSVRLTILIHQSTAGLIKAF
jgi:hypothetical protein